MWERMFDLVLGLKKEHRLMMVITLIYAVTLFGITVDVEAMENWLQLVGYTIRTLCIACIIQLSVFFLTNIFWKELNRGLNKTFVVISGNVLSLAFLLFPFSISYIDMTAESMKLSSLNTERNRIDSMVRYYENLKSLDSSFSENLDSLILEEKKTLIRVIKEGNYIQSYSITLVKRCKDLLSHIGRIFPYKNVFLSVSLTQQLTNHEL